MSELEEKRRESSMPVQTRVSVLTLADALEFWRGNGYSINTMSQLVSWTVDLLVQVLEANGKIERRTSVAEAHSYLMESGLYQKSTLSRGGQKIANAITFENLRDEGLDPSEVVPRQYNMLHNRHSVRTGSAKVNIAKLTEEAVRIYEEKFGKREEDKR